MDLAHEIKPDAVLLDAALELGEGGCLHELFERQVDQCPEAPALIFGDRTISYRVLDEQANQLARYLRVRGAGPGTFIGLLFERSEQPILSILACLKAGAAYVPIDPSYPLERLRHIQEEAELLLLLTDEALLARARSQFSTPVISLGECSSVVAQQSVARLSRDESGLSPADLCYVIYTSGTTGRPKGVMTEHRNAYLFTIAFNQVCGTSGCDRVYQGFSLSFDGSVEEIWMAFSNGSALVLGDRSTPRFGNELGHFLESQGVTYFSTVPTLLSTLTEPVATLRLLVVSGEICPAELVQRWARPGLRMLNVYGPTEATVNTTAAECLLSHPVTIGRPLSGYEIYILNAQLQPVRYGEKGELFIGGQTLARGYLKRPDLTAERFITLAGVGNENSVRLYRTGDLVCWNQRGELEFFGRIDSQVKIRGYRVELTEIESVLLENNRICSASVKLYEKQGLQSLAAYVTLNNSAVERTMEQALDRDELFAQLNGRLPPYMIPTTLDVLEEFPLLTSGKVDRARLPAPVAALYQRAAQIVAPANELEAQIAQVWCRVLGLPEVSVEADFFLDLGGHSLVAAQVVTLLRGETRRLVTVRDAYQFPTIRKLAAHLVLIPERRVSAENASARWATHSSRKVFESLGRKTRHMTAALQVLSIYFLYGAVMVPAVMVFLTGLAWVEGRMSLAALMGYGLLISLLTWPTLVLLSIAAKWLVIGRYRVGSYPLWGFYYFRWWLVGRIQALSGVGALAGTPLMPFYYRLMGAQVGRGCTLDTALCGAWDLVKIGDSTSIGADSQLLGYRVEDGMLTLGRVEIGSRCFIGIHSAMGLNARMGDDARLDDQSLLPDRGVIGHGESRRGSPAQPAEVQVPAFLGITPAYSRWRRVFFGLAHLILGELLACVMLLPSIPLFALWTFAFLRGGMLSGVVTLIASVPLSVILYCLYIALIKRTVLPGVRPGVYPVESISYLRKWLSDSLMKMSKAVLLPLYTTLYLPPWLRLLGAKIGARAELSTVWQFSPELTEVGEESFFADGSIIGGKRFFGGHFEVALNKIGRRSFVGNSAILPVGASLGNGCLLGVQSIPPAQLPCTPDGTEWLGSPAFSLPHRQKVAGFADSVTFRPTARLYFQRAVIDAVRILIPGYIALSSGAMGVLALWWVRSHLGVGALFLLSPVLGLALGLYGSLLVVGLKKAVIGTFKPVIVPLWSPYVWLNEMVNGAYEAVLAPAIGPFLGTPFAATFFRWMGCRMGKSVYIDTTLFSEFDLVEVGDYAALNFGAVIQNHLFEDRVMKSSYLKIGSECSVGNMAVILYDSEMQTGASIGPLSLLMKGEKLAAHSCSHGIPTVQVPDPVRLHSVAALGLRTWLKHDEPVVGEVTVGL